MWWPGLPLLTATNEGIQGGSRDFLYCRLRVAGSEVCPDFSCLREVQSFAPSASGGRSLPGAAWQRRRAVPGPLVTPPGGSRSSSGLFWSSRRRLRPFQGTSRDVQYHRWTVCMWNAASSGGFWQGSPYLQVDIRQGSSWRDLCRA